ncbi:uncharacterized protein TNIN_282911 [Trichonephila inaurata madagascariensis]|uniref:Uncharacterized protein n=1 Tax=Trichonephila inaurata madagascariensis TaxID=2747483 RepID=A0A8X7CLQ7_9ARAC|nr:uncharacterized protein TNIN_282911 [Trichonephila inaurata madagascariensis]
MAFLDRRYVLSLRQMAMAKVAITVCRDPEILDFVKNNGCASFVFPSKETHLYLDVESPVEETWMWKDIILEKMSKFSYLLRNERSATKPDDYVRKENILPFARWEELVEERISSLPQLLKQELLDVIRSFSIEIDKWFKYHSDDWKESLKIARREISNVRLCSNRSRYDYLGNSRREIDREKVVGMFEIGDHYLLAILCGLMNKMPNGEQMPHEIVQKYSKLTENGWSKPIGNVELSNLSRHKYFIAMSYDDRCAFITSLLLEECLQYEDFLFYMSYMSDYDRKQIFEFFSFEILLLFLNWPLQCEFLNAAEYLLPYFSGSCFFLMLNIIIYQRIMLSRKDFNYIDLLKGFWSLSPSDLKEFIKTTSIYEPLLFVINFPADETFLSEQLLERYSNDELKFTCFGAKYSLMRETMPIAVLEHYSYPALKSIHLFLFEKILKDNVNKARVPALGE